jgi:hypothetical protein
MFQTKGAKEIKTHILCSVTFFPENPPVSGITWKIIVQPDDNMAQCALHAE